MSEFQRAHILGTYSELSFVKTKVNYLTKIILIPFER